VEFNMADHNIRIIAEAVVKGGKDLQRFFNDNEKDIKSFRNSVRDLNKEIEVVFTGGGARGRGAGGKFFAIDLNEAETALVKFRQIRQELKRISDDNRSKSSLGQLFSGFSAGAKENDEIRKTFNDRIKLSKEAAQKERDNLLDSLAKQRQATKNHFDGRLRELKETLELEEKAEAFAKTKRIADEANFLEDILRARRRQAIAEGRAFKPDEGTRLEIDRLRALEREINAKRDITIAAAKAELRQEEQNELRRADIDKRRKLREIGKPSVQQIIIDARALRDAEKDVDRLDSRLTKFGRNAGRQFSDFRLGISLGRNELSETDKQFIKTESKLTRLGAAFSSITRQATSFVNVRWAIVISFIQVLGTLVVQFGSALVALASSLILAAAALGGAFLAGLTQLIPVVGLLAAAFSRLGAVLDAVELSEKLKLTGADDQKQKLDSIKQSTDSLAESRYSLIRAGEAVKDSEFNLAQSQEAINDAIKNQTNAVKDLADARKQAARDIVDANFEEREAALALQEATLGIIEAKQRLREEEQRGELGAANIADAQAQVKEAQARLDQVRGEGDQAEIALALQQLSAAEQSLQQIQAQADDAQTNIKGMKIDIKQAELQREEAVVRNKRSQEAAAQARSKGIDGSERVVRAQETLAQATKSIADATRQQVLAQRQLRDSIHALAVAKRSEADAENSLTTAKKKQTAQQEQLQQALADLSPAERGLFNSIRRIRDIYKEQFRPITDIIVNSFSRAVDRVSILLRDPKIIKAAKGLSTNIAGAIDVFSKFAISPEFKNFLAFTIKEAAKNVPKLADTFLNLFKILIRIARVAAPIFNDLIDRFLAFTTRLEEKTRNTRGLEKFFGTAGRHLDSWLRFFIVAGKLLGVIIKFSAPAGKGILDDLTNKLDEWTKWLNDNESKVREFFKNVRADVSALSASLAVALKVLFEAFSSEEQSALTQFILEVLIPAFTLFLQILGKLAQGFIFFTEIPLLGDLLKFIATIVVVEKLFNKLIPATQKLTDAFIALTRFAFSSAALQGIRNWNQLIRASIILAKQGELANTLAAGGYVKLAKVLKILTAIQIRLNIATLTNPYVLLAVAIVALIVGLVLLERKFHIIERSIKSIEGVFRSVADFFVNNWKTVVLAAILAPFSPFLAGAVFLVRFRKSIIGVAQDIINFFKKNWGNILKQIILLPFGISTLGIILRFKTDAIKLIKDTVAGILNEFKKLPGQVKSFLSDIPRSFDQLVNDAYQFGRDLVQGIIDGIASKAIDLKNKIIDIVKGAWGFVKDALGIHSRSQYTYDEIGIPLGQGIVEGASDAIDPLGRVMGDKISAALRNAQLRSSSAKQSFLRSFDDLQSLVGGQIDLRLNAQTPEDKALAAFDAAEVKSQRQEQIKSATDNTKKAKAQVASTNKDIIRAQKAVSNAVTTEEKRAAKESLRAAKQAHADALKQLKDALKQESDTRASVAHEEKRDALQRDADQARERLEKSVAAEHRRADRMFVALKRALDKKDWKSVQSIFNRIVNLPGMENLGKAAAEAFGKGFLPAIEKTITKGVAAKQAIAEAAAKKEAQAQGILDRSAKTRGNAGTAGTLGQGPQRGSKPLTALEKLQTLIGIGAVDKDTAFAIVNILNQNQSREVIQGILEAGNEGDDFAVNRATGIIKRKNKNIGYKGLLTKLLQRSPGDFLGNFLKNFNKSLEDIKFFEEGGEVTAGRKSYGSTSTGQAVPAIVHVGEWVVNKSQQMKLAKNLGMTTEQLRMNLFGTGGKTPGKGTKPTTKASPYSIPGVFNLSPQEDPDGNVVWFIEMADGAFGQVSQKDARKIINSQGRYIPGYVRRSSHGFVQRFKDGMGRGQEQPRGGKFTFGDKIKRLGAGGGFSRVFANGGVVMPGFAGPMLQSFAEGGTVMQQAGFGAPSVVSNNKNIEQNFNVTTQGETDWSYVLRLGALHAQGSYT
jgi:hypothetical protein